MAHLKRHPSRVRPTGSCGLARVSGVTDDWWGPNRNGEKRFSREWTRL